LIKAGPLPGTETPRTCLIVHGDPGIVRMLSRYLEGMHVVGVLDPLEVRSLVEELRPRAVVTSCELAEAVAAQVAATLYDVPVIRCALPQWAQSQGNLLAYLAKPVTPEMLALVMKRVLRDAEATVLLVDDDPDAVRLLERMLTSLPRPYTILKADSGQRALEVMATVVPDVVLLDWVMPGMDGKQVLERMRAEERLCGVPVVVVSARDWVEDGATMGAELVVRWRRPVPVATGARCVQSLLEVLNPSYLPAPGASAQPGPAFPP